MGDVLAVTCPICDATPGQGCVEWGDPDGQRPHVFRVHAATVYHKLRSAIDPTLKPAA
jgi:hypothetical protein